MEKRPIRNLLGLLPGAIGGLTGGAGSAWAAVAIVRTWR
jgi:hypothetical protein